MDRTDPPCVFLGSPAVLTLDQRVRLDAWLDWLQMQALKVVRLERSGYGPKPWEQLTDLLAHGEGAVLLGFPPTAGAWSCVEARNIRARVCC